MEHQTIPTVVSFGGGVNSTALLIGMRARDWVPEAILFADTGGEHASTYAHVDEVEGWCFRSDFPPITRVSNAKPDGHASLEAECLTNKTLPSKAFGFAGCSVKWKRQPMDRWVKAAFPDQQVLRLIGIDYGERHRSANLVDDKWFAYQRPLVDWEWDRDDCVAAIERAGLQVPRKSACWYCPASRKAEVLQLAHQRPELFERAVAMEHAAAPNLGTVKGLGRRWSWESLAAADRAQSKLFPDMLDEAPCGCFDGDDT